MRFARETGTSCTSCTSCYESFPKSSSKTRCILNCRRESLATLTTALLYCDLRGRALLFNVLQRRIFASEIVMVVEFRAPDFRRAHNLNVVDYACVGSVNELP